MASKTPVVMTAWALILMIVLFTGWLLKRIWLGRSVPEESDPDEEIEEPEKITPLLD